MFGICVCRSRSAHIDGRDGFPICLFAHALASRPSFMFRSMFDINVCFVAGKAWRTLSFQNYAVLLLKTTVPIHIFILIAVWPDMTFGLAVVAFIKPLQKYARMMFQKPSPGLSRRDARRAPT